MEVLKYIYYVENYICNAHDYKAVLYTAKASLQHQKYITTVYEHTWSALINVSHKTNWLIKFLFTHYGHTLHPYLF